MNIFYDGFKLNDYFIIDQIQGFGLPITKDRELQLMNSNGSIYESTNFDSRVFTFNAINANTIDKNIYEKLDDIKKIFSPYKGERILTFECYPDRYIEGRYSGSLDVEQIARIQRFPISIKCSNPFFYSNVEHESTINSNLLVDNAGSYPTNKIELQFTADADALVTISNSTSGKQIVIQNDNSSRTFKINMETTAMTDVSGNTNYAKYYQSGTFFNLLPGDNNITITGTTSLTLKHRDCWI